MTATYLRPKTFRVRGPGIDCVVLAENGCDAICSLIERVVP